MRWRLERHVETGDIDSDRGIDREDRPDITGVKGTLYKRPNQWIPLEQKRRRGRARCPQINEVSLFRWKKVGGSVAWCLCERWFRVWTVWVASQRCESAKVWCPPLWAGQWIAWDHKGNKKQGTVPIKTDRFVITSCFDRRWRQRCRGIDS